MHSSNSKSQMTYKTGVARRSCDVFHWWPNLPYDGWRRCMKFCVDFCVWYDSFLCKYSVGFDKLYLLFEVCWNQTDNNRTSRLTEKMDFLLKAIYGSRSKHLFGISSTLAIERHMPYLLRMKWSSNEPDRRQKEGHCELANIRRFWGN